MKVDTIVWGQLVMTPAGPRRVIGTLKVGPRDAVFKADQVQPTQAGDPAHASKDLGDCIVWDS